MYRSLCTSAALALLLAVSLPAQRPAGRMGAKRGTAPRAGKQGGRTIVDKWNRMTPGDRQKAMAKLPPERREKIERQLDQYKNLTPEQRRQLRSRYEEFNHFPPEKQNQARRLFRQFGELPQERQGVVRQEFDSLRGMTSGDRRARIDSDEFRDTFDNREQRLLRDLSGVLSDQ